MYYSGKVTKKGMNDTWQIRYEDEMEDVASELHILPIKILGVGTWTVYCPSDEYKPEEGIIVGQKFLEGEDDLHRIEYAVQSSVDGRIIICARQNLTLLEDDARDLRKQFQIQEVPKTADLSLDNIVAGPRRRDGGTSPTPSSRIHELVVGGLNVSSADGEESGVSKDASTPVSIKKTRDISRSRGSGSTSTSTSDQDGSGVSTLRTRTPVGLVNTPKTQKSSAKSGKRKQPLFRRMQFFLTGTGTNDPAGSAVPVFSKEEYRDLIRKHGGEVVDLVGRENRKRKVFLISDEYARTVKYIYALAAGLPCVSHKWIEDCVRADSVLDYKNYELAAGRSLESAALIPSHTLKPLKDLNIYVTADTDELYNYWKPILTAAEAKLLRCVQSKNEKNPVLIHPNTQLMVTNSDCPLPVLQLAQEKGIPFVTPEWLVQTIITGERVDFDGHPKYRVQESDQLEEEEHRK